MWATMRGDIGPATLASVEREVFAHDPDWDGLSLREIPRQIDRLPETSQVTSADRRRPGVDKIHCACRFGTHHHASSCSWHCLSTAKLPAWNSSRLIIGQHPLDGRHAPS